MIVKTSNRQISRAEHNYFQENILEVVAIGVQDDRSIVCLFIIPGRNHGVKKTYGRSNLNFRGNRNKRSVPRVGFFPFKQRN